MSCHARGASVSQAGCWRVHPVPWRTVALEPEEAPCGDGAALGHASARHVPRDLGLERPHLQNRSVVGPVWYRCSRRDSGRGNVLCAPRQKPQPDTRCGRRRVPDAGAGTPGEGQGSPVRWSRALPGPHVRCAAMPASGHARG